ncbi:hypothetical protein NDU88_004809 [Pleurodeles waltl]|uniref:Uncharacterized protein n=1 Tax=Pleurodeles waltl TaxID=8319 RepID=A0AAV7WVG0_PLEWA|nr:hypothetical protein NDU88_004809 [Pleurodeles waltl]
MEEWVRDKATQKKEWRAAGKNNGGEDGKASLKIADKREAADANLLFRAEMACSLRHQGALRDSTGKTRREEGRRAGLYWKPSSEFYAKQTQA